MPHLVKLYRYLLEGLVISLFPMSRLVGTVARALSVKPRVFNFNRLSCASPNYQHYGIHAVRYFPMAVLASPDF